MLIINFKDIEYYEVYDEIYRQVMLGLPVSCTFLLRKSLDIVSMIFVGHISESLLSAAGLATVTANLTGNSLLVGLAGALTTLCSEANGANDVEALNLALQRGIMLSLCLCVPITILWIYSKDILENMGQQSSLAKDSQQFLCWLIPGLWAYAINICVQNWLHSQQKTKSVAIITAVVAIFHPIWVYLFMYKLEYGYIGASMAISISRLSELVFLSTYVIFSYHTFHEIPFEWSRKAFTGWYPYFELGLPNLMMISEWWASEIIIFLSGFLTNPTIQVASMSIYQNIISLCFMIPSGLQVAASSRVGQALGAEDAMSAKLSAVISPALAGFVSSLTSVIILLSRRHIGALFTNSQDVINLVSKLIFVLSLYILADAIQTACTGVLKGIGKQKLGGPIVIFAYYMIGIPCSIFFGFYYHFGSLGLCIGTLLGTVVHMLGYLVVLFTTDFDQEVENTKVRLDVFKRSQPASFSTPRTSTSTSRSTSDMLSNNKNQLDHVDNRHDFGRMKTESSTRSPANNSSSYNNKNDNDEDWWNYGFEMYSVSPAGTLLDWFGRHNPKAEYELVRNCTEPLDEIRTSDVDPEGP